LLGSSVLSLGGRISPFLPCKQIKRKQSFTPGFIACLKKIVETVSHLGSAKSVYILTFFPVFIKSLQLETWWWPTMAIIINVMPHNDVKLEISNWQSKHFSIDTILLLRGGRRKRIKNVIQSIYKEDNNKRSGVHDCM